MRSRRTVDQWRTAIFRASVSDAVRVYLLKLADHMRADLTVCVPRSQLARELNRHEQRIAERNAAAVRARLLDVVSPGYKGHTAVYKALFPDPVGQAKRTDLQYAKDPLERYAIAPDCVPDGEYTTSKRPPTRPAVGNVPDEKQQLGKEGRGSRASVRFTVDRLSDEDTEERSA